LRLHPVTFRYKQDSDKGPRHMQFGLIAEEVAEVYPALVDYGLDGQPFTVRYDLLPSMLVNELQKQNRRFVEQQKVVATQQKQIDTQQKTIQDLNLRLERLEGLVGK